MRLGIKILNTSASVNSYQEVPFVRVARGENLDLYFQLVDLDQGGLRYIPDEGCTVTVNIPRSPVVVAQQNNTRQTQDYSVTREAINPFNDDRSIFKLPILPAETVNFISNSIRVTLLEPQATKIAWAPSCIKVIDNQNQ